jgi:hypothetical protein
MTGEGGRQESPRAVAQKRLCDHLVEHSAYWTAPYGILDGFDRLPRGGRVRTITFGVARYLDATAYIWSPTRIEVRAEGPLAHRVEGSYGSVDELIARLAEFCG